MAATEKEVTHCCEQSAPDSDRTASLRRETMSASAEVLGGFEWDASGELEQPRSIPANSLPRSGITKAMPGAGGQLMRAHTCHPLDPLSSAEIVVAISTVRATGATPEVRDGMRFIEVVLDEPQKHVVALADAYFFPPYQPSLLPKMKGGIVIPHRLRSRHARLIVYNKELNKTSVWIVELNEVNAAARGGHHRGKVVSVNVVADVQPSMDAIEYAECEATVKDYAPFREAMKKRGIEDMDLVMVDSWCVGYWLYCVA